MTTAFVPRIAAQCLHLSITPQRAYYQGLQTEEQHQIESVLDQYDVQTFRGFNYWAFERREFDGKIGVCRFSWENPRYVDSVDAVVEFLHRYHKI